MFRKHRAAATCALLLSVCLSPLPQAEASEPALALTAKDAALKWGACPDFMPKGCQIAVLHGDAAKPNADIFFKVPENSAIPHHWHTSAERIVLISGKLEVTYDGQDTEILRPGGYAYGPAKLAHEAFCAKGAPCVLFIAFESPIDAARVESFTNKKARAKPRRRDSTTPRLSASPRKA